MKSYNEISEIIGSAMANLNWDREPKGLYEPIAYVLSMGGKRIRPALTLMATNMYKDDISDAILPALGIEVFHNFTLLHDDIMDKAPIRRGRPTVHIKWNDNTAILSGDVMQIAAYQLIAHTPAIHLKKVIDLFSITAAEICDGQQYDVDFEKRGDVTADEYIEMIRLKTAVLIGAALKIGAIIGGASNEDAERLYQFGTNIGLAFQLKDDLLDVYGDEKTFGKMIGGDIVSNKKTYLMIHALSCAKGEIEKELHTWIANNNPSDIDSKIRAIQSIFSQLEVDKICEEKMTEFYTKAIANLEKLNISNNKTQELRNLAQKLMSRKD
jgi:geranylgeranyl diphosphate synthase, type II